MYLSLENQTKSTDWRQRQLYRLLWVLLSCTFITLPQCCTVLVLTFPTYPCTWNCMCWAYFQPVGQWMSQGRCVGKQSAVMISCIFDEMHKSTWGGTYPPHKSVNGVFAFNMSIIIEIGWGHAWPSAKRWLKWPRDDRCQRNVVAHFMSFIIGSNYGEEAKIMDKIFHVAAEFII